MALNDGRIFADLAIFIAATNALALLMQRISSRKLKQHLVKVGHVEQIYIFPIKSCGGVVVDKAICTHTGTQAFNIKDRHFVVVTSADTSAGGSSHPGQVITQRQHPEMALVQLKMLLKPRRPSMHHRDSDSSSETVTLCFSAPGMPDLQIKLPLQSQSCSEDDEASDIEAKLYGQSIFGRHCGQAAALWWQKYLKRDDVVLIHAEGPEHLKQLLPNTVKIPTDLIERIGENDRAAYTDWSPLHVVNAASIDEVNSRIDPDGQPIHVTNFRPNLLLRTATAFEEDNFDHVYIGPDFQFHSVDQTDIGSVVIPPCAVLLRRIRSCDRCHLITVDPQYGHKRDDGEPLKTLRSFRVQRDQYGLGPVFGIDMAIERPGFISKGDAVYATFMDNN